MVERTSAVKRTLRAGWVAIILALALVSAGCESETADEGQANSTATTGPSTTTTGPPLLDETELKAALLTVADLPPEWTSSGESTGPRGQSAKAGRWADWFCDSAVSAVGADTTIIAGANFESPEYYFPTLGQELISANNADEVWESKRQAFDSCVGLTWTSDKNAIGWTPPQYSMTEVTAPAVGDEAVAYLVALPDPNGFPSYTNVVFARRGSVIEFYTGSEMIPTTFDPGEFNALVTTGDHKIAMALGQTSVSPTTLATPTDAKPSQ